MRCPQSGSVLRSPAGSGFGASVCIVEETTAKAAGLPRSSVRRRRVFTDQRIRAAAGGAIEETTAGVSQDD